MAADILFPSLIKQKTGDCYCPCYRHGSNFPEYSINIQYKYNISVKKWQQSTGAPTPNIHA
jgi:hypothetical protein